MKVVEITLLICVIGAASVGIYVYGKPLLYPCSEPITYSVTEFDSRFGISEAELADALADAAALLNDAAGKVVVAPAEDADVAVMLSYGDLQQTATLGEDINAEQAAYNAKRLQVEALRTGFTQEERSYERAEASYERRVEQYEAQVRYWNERGGAPAAEYEKLQRTGSALQGEQESLAVQAAGVNTKAQEINERVDELNALAKKLNAKVYVYNEDAGEEFDQGRYVSDMDGKRILLYEFTDGTELRRVLAHEFGHALGMDHVENPASILYSFNIGTELELTPEDIAELKQACRLE